MTILRVVCIGDIVGKPGRKSLATALPQLRQTYTPDIIVANVENASSGSGLTLSTYQELITMGVDAMTSGNHIFSKRDIIPTMDTLKRLVRPLNFPKGNPGVGYRFFEKNGVKIAIINLIGRVFMGHSNCPFQAITDILDDVKKETNIILVDIHAETTSEKKAMAFYLDGKVSCVFGTHTHVQTADDWIMPSGTSAITDIGMTGSMNSVIGVKKEIVITRFLTQMPERFETSTEFPWMVNGIYLEIDTQTGQTIKIERILKIIRYEETV